MMRDELASLAERIEAASGPDRELDAAIWLAVTPGATRRKTKYLHEASGQECEIDETRDASHRLIIVPSYCASLDAAMSLAEAYGGQLTFFKDGTAKAFLWQPYPLAVEAKAATPALALTAAALRARATNAGGGL